MAQEAVDTKATRLIRTRPVKWVDATTVLVDGDHDRYLVRKRAEGTWSCTCPWGVYKSHVKPCSHVLAAALKAPFVTEVA
ncbi:MAG TPA: SWIM zinc finger family protein [Candidatus Xenobia bacterium]